MKTIQVVSNLINKGYNVKYSTRSDGGILIRSISKGGKTTKFTGAKGNTFARKLTGSTLSEKQISQRKTSQAKQWSDIDVKSGFKRDYLRAKRAYRKATDKAKQKMPKIDIKITRKSIEKIGYKKTMEHLSNIEKYYKGIAYDKNILRLIELMDTFQSKTGTLAFDNIMGKLKIGMGKIKEQSIGDIYQIMYELENGRIDSEEASRLINSILNK